MFEIKNILEKMADKKASDLHLTVGLPPVFRIYGKLIKISNEIITSDISEKLSRELLNKKQLEDLKKNGEVDLSLSYGQKHRFRLNIYRQKGLLSFAFRYIPAEIPDFESLGIPDSIIELCTKNSGLVLITGPTGTGKTTTLSAMVDWINTNRSKHIVTLEEPIEYMHHHKKSIVHQREIGSDSISYTNALRAVLRQDPDVILIGEMRDLDSISIALTAAETGHLVLSTLHTIGISKTVDRIIDVFPPYQQNQIRTQLAMVLHGVLSQQLITSIDSDSLVLAYEMMITNSAVRTLIRENKTHQIPNIISTNSNNKGMVTLDKCLANLCKKNKISIDDAVNYCVDPEYVKRLLET